VKDSYKDTFKGLKKEEKKALIAKIVKDVEKMSAKAIKDWEPIDRLWETVEGCAYLRLSTKSQVSVEKGSLEQQVNIAITSARRLSRIRNKNYKVIKFFIEPGESATDEDRKEFQNLKSSIRRSEFQFVIFKELSRLVRNIGNWINFRELSEKKGVKLCEQDEMLKYGDHEQLKRWDIKAVEAQAESRKTGKRVSESNFHSLVYSKKFNGVKAILGLEPKVENNRVVYGYYRPVPKEIKLVETIMRMFLKYESYPVTVAKLKNLGIKNIGDKEFKKDSLKRLLTNLKYLGEWEINVDNKDKNELDLMPYEKYAYVKDFPHGCLLCRELFAAVKEVVKKIATSKTKRHRTKRDNPLVGILLYKDGTRFRGDSGTKKNGNLHYYYKHDKTGYRIKVDDVESEVEKVVIDLLTKSPRWQEAINQRWKNAKELVEVLEDEIKSRELELVNFEKKKEDIANASIKVMTASTSKDAEYLISTYTKKLSEIDKKIAEINGHLKSICKSRDCARKDSFDYNEAHKHAKEALKLIREKKLSALKPYYRLLFESIIVGDRKPTGDFPIEYNFRNETDITMQDTFGYSEGMVGRSRAIAKNLAVLKTTIKSTLLKPKPFRDKFLLHQKYIVEGLSTRQIAELFFSCKNTVKRYLEKYGIPIREESKHHGRNSVIKFGERRLHGKVIQNRTEQRTINAILKMSERGMTGYEIAEFLNTMKVLTKQKGKRWHYQTVRKILDRETTFVKNTI